MSDKTYTLLFFENKFSEVSDKDFIETYKSIVEVPNQDIVITLIREVWDWSSFNDWIKSIQASLSRYNHTVYFIVNSTFNYSEVDDSLHKYIFSIDFFLSDAVFRYRYDQTLKINAKWNSDNSQVLFLSGKPDYYNRYQPVLYLSQQGRLHDFVYSYHGTKISDLRDINMFYPNQLNIVNTLKKLSNILDIEFQRNHYSGYPFDPNLYKNTVLSLIPEGVLDYHTSGLIDIKDLPYSYSPLNAPFITEKTYRAILNHHPFIILGEMNSLKYLESIGFKTFREYLKYPDYNEVELLQDRILYGIENSLYFLDTYKKYQSDIERDTKHNFENLIKIANSQWNSISLFNDRKLFLDFYLNCSYELDRKDISKID